MNLQFLIDYIRDFNLISIIFRLLLSVILSSFIGAERSKIGRAAGLRTHILVCLGATLSAMSGLYLNKFYNINEISRIAAQVVSGIGFLGAGTILIRNKSMIIGLTTAACVWTTGAVGIVIGFGFYEAAIIATLLVFLVTKKLGYFDKKLHNFKEITVYFEFFDYNFINKTISEIESNRVIIENINVKDSKINLENSVALEVSMNIKNEILTENLIKDFNKIENIAFALLLKS